LRSLVPLRHKTESLWGAKLLSSDNPFDSFAYFTYYNGLMKNLSVIIIASLAFSFLTGCQLQKRVKAVITGQPDLRLSAIAQYVQQDGSRYLTRQQYDIYASPKAMIVASYEPVGDIILTLQNAQADVFAGKPKRRFDKQIYDLITNPQIAQAILELQLVSMQGTKPTGAPTENETINFDGRLYELVYITDSMKLYKNKSTGMINLVISTTNNTGNLVFYGYNYQTIVQQKNLYASKIDIYSYPTSLDKKLIAQIEFFN